ncbi:hypothetical protein ACQ7HM_08755 [Williamsia sp. MIQD14]|uniref:hypothetical protein n=1 Tax=Williamsia sp. MIQD14 TaxID=3425703 RepID=UPI003DA1C68C
MTGTLVLAGAHVTTVLARDADGPEFGKASPLGLLLVLLLLVGTVFLIRSMNKRLRKLPTSFSRDEPQPDQAADDGTDPGSVGNDTDPARGRDN